MLLLLQTRFLTPRRALQKLNESRTLEKLFDQHIYISFYIYKF